MPTTYYKIATKKHEALLPLSNPYVTRDPYFSSFDDALHHAKTIYAKYYQFQILKIEVVYEGVNEN